MAELDNLHTHIQRDRNHHIVQNDVRQNRQSAQLTGRCAVLQVPRHRRRVHHTGPNAGANATQSDKECLYAKHDIDLAVEVFLQRGAFGRGGARVQKELGLVTGIDHHTIDVRCVFQYAALRPRGSQMNE